MSEKVATPTSVILMAGNAVVGASWSMARGSLATEAWNYWQVCVPVVVVGAPLGAYFIRQRTRQFIARFLYASIFVQFLAALIIVPQTASLLLFTGAVFAGGSLLFAGMSSAGAHRLRSSSVPVLAGAPGS